MRLLAQGTVIFEDISIEQFEGTVIKVIPKVTTKNQVRNLNHAFMLTSNLSFCFLLNHVDYFDDNDKSFYIVPPHFRMIHYQAASVPGSVTRTRSSCLVRRTPSPR